MLLSLSFFRLTISLFFFTLCSIHCGIGIIAKPTTFLIIFLNCTNSIQFCMNFRKSSHQLVAINRITHKLFQHLRNIIQLLQRREFTSYLINRQLLVYSLNKLTFTLFQFFLSFLKHFLVIIKIRIKGFIILLHNTSHLLFLLLEIYLQFFTSSI